MNAQRPQPQLSHDELLQLKWLLGGALTLLSASTVLYLDLGASGLVPVLVAVIGAGLWRPDMVARVPRWVHRLAFQCIVTFFTLDLWLTGELLAATVRLDLLLLLYRGLVYRQRRDDLQVIVLGLFLIVLAGVLTVSLSFAVQILVFTAGALALLFTLTLAQSHEPVAAREPPRGNGEAPRWARQVSWLRLAGRVRAVMRWRVVAFGAGLFAGLVVVSVVLFLAIPRFQLENSFFLERFVTKKARTGFSDAIRFGEVTEITEDNGVALSVDVSDRSQIPVAPYWRMLVLDDYRDGTFRVSPALRRSFGTQRNGTAVRGTATGATAESLWVFYLESGVSRFLPLLGPFATLRFQERQTYHFARPLGIVALRTDPATMLAYRVERMQTASSIPDATFATQLRERRPNPRAAAALMLSVGLAESDRTELAAIIRTRGRRVRRRRASSVRKLPAGWDDSMRTRCVRKFLRALAIRWCAGCVRTRRATASCSRVRWSCWRARPDCRRVSSRVFGAAPGTAIRTILRCATRTPMRGARSLTKAQARGCGSILHRVRARRRRTKPEARRASGGGSIAAGPHGSRVCACSGTGGL